MIANRDKEVSKVATAHLMDQQASAQLHNELFDPSEFPESDTIAISPIAAVNVASVPKYSPLRYPGGKTWLIPHVRHWLSRLNPVPRVLVEPFAGGGIVSLTAVMERLVERCLMIELDRDVAAFWHAALRQGPALCRMIMGFEATRQAVQELSASDSRDLVRHGFRTLVLNRTRRGGILAAGASLSRTGENGRGVASRWYPETLTRRLAKISERRSDIGFLEGDGMAMIESLLNMLDRDVVLFVDPPYTAGGKRAGRRLYAHNELDHHRLFAMLAESGARFLMTYDRAPEIEALVERHNFHAVQVIMKNTHHALMPELVISPEPVFVG